LTFIRFDVRVFPLAIALMALPAMGQVTPETSPPQSPQATPAPAAPKPKVPDYPEPRTLTIGAFYWLTQGAQPSIFGGSQALDYETIKDIGKPKRSPGIEASYPITRTGELKLEYSRTKGDGNQNAPAALDLFTTGINQGDYLATQYQMQHAKLYLDDLLFPHKFPVAKFRVKSLWEVQWVQIKNSIDAPLVDAAGVTSGSGVTETATGTKNVILPTFGLAAEYALTPHILVRVDGSGFGLYHKADLWDANATISFRKGPVEVMGGAKALHFKSSPNSVEYESATFTGAFVGLRYHWTL
jgi:hypothetical protein